MRPCKYCANGFEDDQMEMHEQLCAKNPDVAEKQRKLGELEVYVKTAILTDGVITDMYWAHSKGDKNFMDHLDEILTVWREKWPGEDYVSHLFLRDRGFRVMVRN